MDQIIKKVKATQGSLISVSTLWNPNRKHTPLALVALDVEGAVVEVDEFFGQRQSQADAFIGAGRGVVRLAEPVKNDIMIFFWDPDAGIRNTDMDVLFIFAAGKGYRSCRGKLDRVIAEDR